MEMLLVFKMVEREREMAQPPLPRSSVKNFSPSILIFCFYGQPPPGQLGVIYAILGSLNSQKSITSLFFFSLANKKCTRG